MVNLIELVKDEAAKLKQLATKEERSKLSIRDLIPSEPRRCIYGQMTSSCYSERAQELINACCETGFGNIMKPTRSRKMTRTSGTTVWSPIETYILNDVEGKGTKKLLRYLKGTTDTLDIK